MNEVFIIGKITTEVKFDFVLNSKYISISTFKILTLVDKQQINIIGYDEIADYTYANIKLNDITILNGYLEEEKVVLKKLKIIERS